MVDSRSTVLYAEDDENDRLFMQMAFQKAGLPGVLRTVPDGKAAVDYLSGVGPYADRARHPLPALVLLDLNMPLLPGFEVLKWVRANPALKRLPVVIFSSSSKDEDKAQAKALGAADYIEKPSTIARWAEVVSRLQPTWSLAPEPNPPCQAASSNSKLGSRACS